MEEIRGRLISRISRSSSIESFRFKLGKKIDFMPGQFLQVIFDEEKRNNRDLNKYLSLSSSPTKDYIEVTKRLSKSEFSQSLIGLKPGDDVLFRLPMGECTYREDFGKIGFLIGGIGITPVISIIEYIVEKKLGTDLYLFYSNKVDTDIAFKKELDGWQETNRNIKVYYTVTECEPTDNKCLFGFIDEKLLQEKGCDLTERIVYIFGPPTMVESMCALSMNLACRKENLRIEQFTGY